MHGKAITAIAAGLAFLSLASGRASACTNVIVTKGASADGSVFVSYAADSHQLFGELYFSPAADWKPGSMRKVYDWDSGRYLGEIPQPAHTYKRVGNMNEHQMIIAETTFGGRSELENPDGGIDYGSLIYVALERCKTAREAIRLISDLAGEYGYYSSGETFTIADKNEVWIMELIGKGPSEKGIVWVARRIPDGYICAHANQSRISTFPLDDPENCLYAQDVISFARSKGYFDGEDKDFSFVDAYCPPDFGGLRGCEARTWSAFNILGGGDFVFEDENGNTVCQKADSYLDFAMGYNKEHSMPLFIRPARKLTVKDVADVMRDHYEGTPMDLTADIGAGGNALPYRWRPMEFEYGGKTYVNERAIATQQTGFWFVGQSRSALPDVIGGIIWFGTDDAATSYLTPIYTNTDEVPNCFKEGNGNMLTYSDDASFWINNRVANACYKMYNHMASFVRERIDAFENGQMEKVLETDRKALELYAAATGKAAAKASKKGIAYDPSEDTGKNVESVRKYLTAYSVETAQNQFQAWKDLEKLLLVKFMDGNVKAQNEDGSFVHNEYSTGIPDNIGHPEYTENWKKIVSTTHGEVLEVR